MKLIYCLLLLSLVALQISCKKNDALENEEVRLIYEQFMELAEEKNVLLRDNKVKIYFKELDGPIGQCVNSKKIQLDQELWDRADFIEKQYVLFHELGHCVLDRKHKNEIFFGQQCKSLMKGAENCFNCSFDFNSEIWREYYIDELFDESTLPPSWLTLPKVNFDTLSILKINIENTELNNTIAINLDTFYKNNENFENFFIQFRVSDLDYSKRGTVLSLLTIDNESINYQFNPYRSFYCEEFSLPKLSLNDCHVSYKNYENFEQSTTTELTLYVLSGKSYFLLNGKLMHVKEICSPLINTIIFSFIEKNVTNFKDIKEHLIDYKISVI